MGHRICVEAVHHAAHKSALGPISRQPPHTCGQTRLRTELDDGAKYFRSPRLGGWCFSDARHGWPVSDTTAEALCADL